MQRALAIWLQVVASRLIGCRQGIRVELSLGGWQFAFSQNVYTYLLQITHAWYSMFQSQSSIRSMINWVCTKKEHQETRISGKIVGREIFERTWSRTFGDAWAFPRSLSLASCPKRWSLILCLTYFRQGKSGRLSITNLRLKSVDAC